MVCGGTALHEKLRKGGVQLWQCASCGLASWFTPAGFCPEQTYDTSYFCDATAGHGYDDYEALEPALRRTFARRLSRLPRPRSGARLLDVGAAFGFAVVEAQRAGWQACGLDVSLPAARRAAQVTRGNIVVGSAIAPPFLSAAFDAVTMWDVLEHVADPHASISEVARLLRPGGSLRG